MARYHVNPDSGVVGICVANVRCRFGANAVHYADPADARRAFEEAQALPAPLKKDLTRDQQQALTTYQGGMFYDINRALRRGSLASLRPQHQATVEFLDSIFARPHESPPPLVYRVVRTGEDTGYLDRPLSAGEIIEEQGFLSTSESEQFVEDCFDHGMDGEAVNTVMAIEPRADSSCIRPTLHTYSFDGEAEVLFGRSHRFEVLEDDQTGSRRYITLRMV